MIAQPQYAFAPTMPMMAEGGLVAAAKDVQSKGRGEDTMLVHMTPGEVGGLQALAMQHGGSLTINPQTGLPEASFLKSLLPTLIGAALTIGSGGVINPATAGLIVGGIQTVRTGDLGQGLMAGLGAYGGAGLGAGLSSAGAATTSTVAPSVGTGVGSAATSSYVPSVSTLTPATAPTAQVAGQTIGQNFAQAGRGFTNLMTGQPGSFDKFVGTAAQAADPSKGTAAAPATGMGGGLGALKTAGALTAPSLLQQPEYAAPQAAKEESSSYTGPYTPTERRVSYPDEERRRRSSEFAYFTPSNPVPFERGGSVPQLENGGFVLTKKAVDGLGRGSNKKGQQVASRGLGAVPIKGPGTGTSDSIKTTIDGKHPARISNGEAYVPRKEVKRRGGADKFYALMKKAERAAA